jgi:hypothetical protein
MSEVNTNSELAKEACDKIIPGDSGFLQPPL